MVEDEVYVMLMMMRGYTPVEWCTAEELLACITADDYDACIAACAGDEEPVITKKGTLNVSAKANDGTKIFIDGISELDTIKLSASEEISVEKVTLEKYGYSSNTWIEVWLENEDGIEIATSKYMPTTKDEVTLTIKKDYRNALETKAYVIVVKADNSASTLNAWDTLWFKVKDVTSSAETLKIASYTATTYPMVNYDSSSITAELKGSNTTYNYEAWKSYQVAKMRIKAGKSEVTVDGFTLKNVTTDNKLDLTKYISKVEVKAWDTSLRLSTADLNKQGEVRVVFPAQTVEAKKYIDLTVYFTLTDDFDALNSKVKFDLTAVSAKETKTSARLTATGAAAAEYTFAGTKVKLTNTKLGKISAPRGKEAVVVAEWTLEVWETINVDSFDIKVTTGALSSLELWINWLLVDEWILNTGKDTFTFSNVVFEKGGKLEFVADLVERDDAPTATSITFSPASFSKNLFVSRFGTYDESSEDVALDNVAWSISFSNISVETAKWTLENTLSREVEVIADGSTKIVTIFDGRYTAKKGSVYLNSWTLTLDSAFTGDNASIVLYVTVWDSEFDVTFNSGDTTKNDTFSNVFVENGKSVNVKIEAEVTAENTGKPTFTLALAWEDEDGIDVDSVSEESVAISCVANGSVTVLATNANDVVLRKNNLSLVKFTVKPKNDLTELNTLKLTWFGALSGKVEIYVDGDKLDITEDYTMSDDWTLEATWLNLTMDSDGVVVEVKVKNIADDWSQDTWYNVVLDTVNGKSVNKTFKTKIVPALVKVTAQENLWDETVYTLSVEKADEEYEVKSIAYKLADWTSAYFTNGTISDGDTVRILNWTAAQYITVISYMVDTTNVGLEKATYEDYFRVGSAFLKVFKAQD